MPVEAAEWGPSRDVVCNNWSKISIYNLSSDCNDDMQNVAQTWIWTLTHTNEAFNRRFFDGGFHGPTRIFVRPSHNQLITFGAPDAAMSVPNIARSFV
jgi:hypothetical protein